MDSGAPSMRSLPAQSSGRASPLSKSGRKVFLGRLFKNVRPHVKRLKKLKRRWGKLLSKRAKRKGPKTGPHTLYQVKRSLGTVRRWEIISANLDERDQSLLDVGCNLGLMTRFAPDKGLLALGIDSAQRAIIAASSTNHDVPHLAFMRSEITPEMVAKLPSFDVFLCLSVYHHWMSIYGEATA